MNGRKLISQRYWCVVTLVRLLCAIFAALKRNREIAVILPSKNDLFHLE